MSGGQFVDGTERETHIDDELGLFVPKGLREFDSQIVFRTPRATIQHFGSQPLDGYYGMIRADQFGDPDEMEDPKNPDLAPDRVKIKPQGEEPVMLTVDTEPEIRTDGGTVEDTPDRPQWVCAGCGKAVSGVNRPAHDCHDCGGHFVDATPGRLECEICRDPDASRVLNSEHNRLCDDCIELENAGLGHLEILRIKECTRCGQEDPDKEYGIKGIARIGGNLCTDCILEMGDNSSTDTDRDGGESE